MIGSVGTTIATSSVSSIPGGLITSPFYGYTGGAYFNADSINPGRAYWVKVSAPAQLVLSSAGVAAPRNRIRIVPSEELPPPPPAGVSAGASPGLPATYALRQNYPNPFNPSTSVRFSIPVESAVSLRVYNTMGQLVETLVDGELPAGSHAAAFNAEKLAGGAYLYKLTAGDVVETKIMMLVK
jgi:hypothetical protein